MVDLRHKTVKDALEALDNAVKDRGEDFVYPEEWKTKLGSCMYFHGSCPACIVGHVLHQWGLKHDTIAYGEHSTLGEAEAPLGGLNTFLSEGVLEVLTAAQIAQDEDTPWGEAVRQAHESAATLGED